MSTLKAAMWSATVCLVCCAAGTRGQTVDIKIDSPAKGAEVGRKETVQGTVSDPTAKVFVLIRSVEDSIWWVQRVPHPPNRDGHWETLCYFGKADEGPGENFLIIALVARGLKEGQQFDELPLYVARSETIKVRRREREKG